MYLVLLYSTNLESSNGARSVEQIVHFFLQQSKVVMRYEKRSMLRSDVLIGMLPQFFTIKAHEGSKVFLTHQRVCISKYKFTIVL